MNAVRNLRALGIAEGISFLLLLFVAMPLKYQFDMPMAVRVLGSVHGLLFSGFLAFLTHASIKRDWAPTTSFMILVASVLPFGFLLIDKKLKQEIQLAQQAESEAETASSEGSPEGL